MLNAFYLVCRIVALVTVVLCTRVICLICTSEGMGVHIRQIMRARDTTDMYHDCRLIARGGQPITLASMKALTGSVI